MTITDNSPETLKSVVRKHYGRAVLSVLEGNATSCCGGTRTATRDPITSDLYDASDCAQVPGEAVAASFGCGNPTALAELSPGERVLDLGAGAGLDVLLSAKRVGPTGRAYGLDMTDEMLAAARENQRRAGVENAEFLKGDIENIPLPDGSVDVIISNCVINLSADKRRVLAESFRVLRPGGRFAVSDIVTRGDVPESARKSFELWAGCIAGALDEQEFSTLLREVGFEDVSIEPTRVYTRDDALAMFEGLPDLDTVATAMDGKLLSAFVRARKPAAE